MRLIYPVLWSRPGRTACQEQTINTAAALARQGHDVTLLVPRGDGDPVLTPDSLRQWFAVEGDFRIVQRPSRSAGYALLPSLRWLRQVFRDRELRGADLLYSRVPAMLAMGGLSPIPFATDHYRPWPDEWPFIRPLVKRTARRPHCLGCVIHSDYAAGSYRRAGVPAEKLLVAHNGFHPEQMLPRLEKREARAELGLPADRPIAVYAGRMDGRKGLDQILALAQLRPETLFLLVGSEGPGPVEQAASARSNVQVFPWQEPGALAPFLYAADVLLLPASSAPLRRFRTCVLPMKTYLYLAAGRPILAPASPDTAELLKDESNALLVPPDRPALAAAALDRLIGDPALAARLASQARQAAEALTWDARAAKIAAFLEARAALQASA